MSLKSILGGGKSSPAKEKSSVPIETNPAFVLDDHRAPICFLHVQHNLLISCSTDGVVTLWDFKRQEAQRSFKADVRHCVIRGNILLTAGGSSQYSICAWDLRSTSPMPVARLIGHTNVIKEMQQSGEYLYSCSADGSLRTWDLQFAEEDSYTCAVQLTRSSKHTYSSGSVAANCFLCYGVQILVGHADGIVRVWKASNSTTLASSWSGHTGAITCMQAGAPGNIVATGSMDGTVRCWLATSGTCMAVLKCKSPIVSISLRGDCAFVLAADNKEVVSWSIKSGKPLRRYEGHSSNVTSMRVTLLHLFTASADGTLRRFEIKRGHCENVFVGHRTPISCFRLRGSMLLSGENAGNILMWDVLQHDLESTEDAKLETDYLQEELTAEIREANTYLSVQDLGSRSLSSPRSAASSPLSQSLQHSKSLPLSQLSPSTPPSATSSRTITSSISEESPSLKTTPPQHSSSTTSLLFASAPPPTTSSNSSVASSNSGSNDSPVLRASAPPAPTSLPFSTWKEFFLLCRIDANTSESLSKTMLEEGMELSQIPDLTGLVMKELNFTAQVANAVLALTRNSRLVHKGDQWRLESR